MVNTLCREGAPLQSAAVPRSVRLSREFMMDQQSDSHELFLAHAVHARQLRPGVELSRQRDQLASVAWELSGVVGNAPECPIGRSASAVGVHGGAA
jgi:hypothetical protein